MCVWEKEVWEVGRGMGEESEEECKEEWEKQKGEKRSTRKKIKRRAEPTWCLNDRGVAFDLHSTFYYFSQAQHSPILPPPLHTLFTLLYSTHTPSPTPLHSYPHSLYDYYHCHHCYRP